MVRSLQVILHDERLTWSVGKTEIQVTVPGLISGMADSDGRRVFALVGRENNNPTHLVGFAPSGLPLFRVAPPPGFTFSFLTHHPLAPIAVVAGGDSPSDNFRDWHFSIDESGTLKRLAPAY
jgi:hypothetical protein